MKGLTLNQKEQALREAEEFRTRGLDEREKRADELAQQHMQYNDKCRDTLRKEWERFHAALSPRFEKHFSVRAARLGPGDEEDRK